MAACASSDNKVFSGVLAFDSRLSGEETKLAAKDLHIMIADLPESVFSLLYLTNGIGDPLPSERFGDQCEVGSPALHFASQSASSSSFFQERVHEEKVSKRPTMSSCPPQSIATSVGDRMLISSVPAVAALSVGTGSTFTECKDESPSSSPGHVRRLVSQAPQVAAKAEPFPHRLASMEDLSGGFSISKEQLLRHRAVVIGIGEADSPVGLRASPVKPPTQVLQELPTQRSTQPQSVSLVAPGLQLDVSQQELERRLLGFLSSKKDGTLSGMTSVAGSASAASMSSAGVQSDLGTRAHLAGARRVPDVGGVRSDPFPCIATQPSLPLAGVDVNTLFSSTTSASFTQPACAPRSRVEALVLDPLEDTISEIDSDEGDYLSDPDEPVEIILGPTEMAALPMRLEDLSLVARGGHRKGILLKSLSSSSQCLSVSDAICLSNLRAGEAPLSFGSIVHINYGQSCRPCMFERWSGRCVKSWLCDFCHMHTKPKPRSSTGARGSRHQAHGRHGQGSQH